MDAFYAAVETVSDPSLKGKPMAVGGFSMAANYEVRKFAVRAAMHGFIARKLCPDLIFVPVDFTKNYDPHFIAGSLDEAYLDITEVCQERGLSGGEGTITKFIVQKDSSRQDLDDNDSFDLDASKNCLEERQENSDFHLAQRLQNEESGSSSSTTPSKRRILGKEKVNSKPKKQKPDQKDSSKHIPIHTFFTKKQSKLNLSPSNSLGDPKSLPSMSDILTSSRVEKATRELSRIRLHVDMDAFYAAVETVSDPSLKGKPMAVGGFSMAANYEVRKFAVRAAMHGFIARKLCPDLIFVPVDFTKNYDPHFIAGSLDEAYLDITEVCQERGLSGGEIAKELRSSVYFEKGLDRHAVLE
ncbi:unnamed protein product [Arabidopsis arenosa]|uniref:UmuC domain-containing protein n=1 Tax=Arabidopsis arenosa TaxID=38785 RepID=A0A8S2A905_ARAAE|nr:unnamed protein product [Arabidopsis arenosa]